jgi:hypothetical protein
MDPNVYRLQLPSPGSMLHNMDAVSMHWPILYSIDNSLLPVEDGQPSKFIPILNLLAVSNYYLQLPVNLQIHLFTLLTNK